MDAEDQSSNSSPELPARRSDARSPERPAADRGRLAGPDVFEEEEGPDWRRLLEGVWRWKWIVLAVTALGVGAGYFLMQRAQPVYETRATVWLGPSEQKEGPVKPADIFEGQGWADLMTSQAVLEPVAREERLYVRSVAGLDSTRLSELEITANLEPGTYRLVGMEGGRFELLRSGGEVEQRGRLGRDTVGVPVGFRWRPDPTVAEPGSEVLFRVVRPTDAAGMLRDHLQVAYNPRSGNLINTHLRWSTAEGAARLHNALLDSFLQVAQRLKQQKLHEIVSILERQTDYAAARLDSAELALESFRVETVTLPSEPQTTAVPGEDGPSVTTSPGSNVFGAFFERKLERDRLQSQVQDLRQILGTSEAEGKLNVLSLRMNPATEQSRQLSLALDELTNKEAELRTMLQQYTEAYPPVQRLQERIRDLRQEMIPGLVRDLVGQLETRIAELDRQIQRQASQLREVPTRSIQEARLRREVEMAEQLHNDLLSRLKNAELAARTNLPDIQVVDRAARPGSPAEDPGARLFVMASLVGLGLGIGGALLMDRLDDKVRYPDQVTDGMGLPMLGVIPRIPEPGQSGERSQEVLESFRAVRTQLSRAGGPRDSVYLVTSPFPKEGKTLVVANLGISFAASGVRTLIVDADTRRGNLNRFFNLRARPGLTEYLAGQATLEQTEVATDTDGLTVIPHGSLADFRPEVLDGARMDEFLRRVRGRYDIVLLDAPPLIAGTDALVMGERSDGVVFVLRTGETDRQGARARLTGIGNFDLPVLGAVMNDVPARGRYYQYYYYSYQPAEIEAGGTEIVQT